MLNGLKTNNVSVSVARNILISLQIMREKNVLKKQFKCIISKFKRMSSLNFFKNMFIGHHEIFYFSEFNKGRQLL